MGIGNRSFHWAPCPVPGSYGNGGRLPDGRDLLECRSGAVSGFGSSFMSGFGNSFKFTGVSICRGVGIEWNLGIASSSLVLVFKGI